MGGEECLKLSLHTAVIVKNCPYSEIELLQTGFDGPYIAVCRNEAACARIENLVMRKQKEDV